ncbi:hypothetical protein [Ensifer sp. BR816]|uniref:hypothetical protein n=1 Tax=Rhizobium sp. (strain BR816) TaxID=1057002 RepID=UPI001FD894EF|nr:hypothetical protein [Ensifer sp. BR816]
MAHEETADLLRSARPKILQNSISARTEEPKSNFAKISGESYPVRGWPQKQAVVYTSDIKREWFGATEGRDKPPKPPGSALPDIVRAPWNAASPGGSPLCPSPRAQPRQAMNSIRCPHHHPS